MRTRLLYDFEGFADDNAKGCLSRELDAGVLAALKKETLKAPPEALGALMADHTQLDWRPILPRISIPCLVMVGRLSQVFPWEGCAFVGEVIPNASTVIFEDCDHWLYLEEPKRFNEEIIKFANATPLSEAREDSA